MRFNDAVILAARISLATLFLDLRLEKAEGLFGHGKSVFAAAERWARRLALLELHDDERLRRNIQGQHPIR